MFINKVDILKHYNAYLVDRDIQACNIVTYSDWLEKSFEPIIYKQKEGYSVVNVKLFIEGNNEEEILLKISEILKLCEKCVLSFNDLAFYYDVTLDKHTEEIISDKAYALTLNFKSTFKFKNQVIENLNKISSKSINVSGNLKTPCIVEINPSIDMIDLKLEGLSNDPITIKNLKQNKKIIIDGIMGTITQEGINKFKDTDMWEFPFLIPEVNIIKLSKDNCNITIKYNPRWI